MSSGETIEITLTDPQAAILNSNADRNLLMMGQEVERLTQWVICLICLVKMFRMLWD